MSMEHPHIVYVGDVDEGRAFAAAVEPMDWGVYIPGDLIEALGMVVTYLPEVVIVDMTTRPTLAAEVYYHLRTMIGIAPRILLRSGDLPEPDEEALVLPYGSSRERMIAAITEMTQPPIPSL